MIRAVFTGSESTGKSTIAEAVGRHFGVEIVPEFVRRFAEERGGRIEFGDHGLIARGQIALEDDYLARAGDLLLQDTDLLSTVVYCRHYFGRSPAWIEAAALERRPDIYLLCGIDLTWVADGVRDRGHMREEMHSLFRQAVEASGVVAVDLNGSWEERVARAISAIESLRARRKSATTTPA